MVECLTCNEVAGGSIPLLSSSELGRLAQLGERRFCNP